MWKARYLYVILLPTVVYYVLFHYVPMYGVVLAFKDYQFNEGILGSPWAGLKYFREAFSMPEFTQVFLNTVIIAVGRLIIEFPAPILVALLLNEVARKAMKRFYQTVFTFPHFLSWVIVSGIMTNVLADMGLLNQLLVALGWNKVNLLIEASSFRWLLFGTSIWKEMGWGTIIYLAAMASINPELYEAASIDGAGRRHKMLYITWPGIRGTVFILLILAIGNIMNGGGFEQIFNLYNPGVYQVADILDTYIYRTTFSDGGSFSFSTAIGLFKSVINCVMLLAANAIIRKRGEAGLF
ncbi:ABC transporter permease [Paenibacillus sp. J5C2022]|uniref:ABC transporter permease n=1 Tax=Paenibacillus sp. J5C2022 TaxID=2977129 RepID=UPI0021D3284F|nr:ABC transporter permease subunit [Paenibacillus sp. J5C2022]